MRPQWWCECGREGEDEGTFAGESAEESANERIATSLGRIHLF